MKRIIAANWKMYKTWDQAREASRRLAEILSKDPADGREVVLFPSAVLLPAVAEELRGSRVAYGPQNLYPAEEGAFTGETGWAQLRDLHCAYALVGHSERRHLFGEKDVETGDKVEFTLQKGIKPVLCIGETLDERRAGQVESILHAQLRAGLEKVDRDMVPENLVIAYEPVWAIGTGEVAGPEEITASHAAIRKWLTDHLVHGSQVRILYGGSVKPENCSLILGLDNVNGVLVGGASLDVDTFSKIIFA